MQKKPTKEAQIKLAKLIREFVINKWKNLKRGSKFLGISPSGLSMVLSGNREPTKKLILNLVNNGFDEENFNQYYISRNEPDIEHLSKKELIEFANQQRFLIYQYQDMVKFLSLRVDQLSKVN